MNFVVVEDKALFELKSSAACFTGVGSAGNIADRHFMLLQGDVGSEGF